MDELIKNIIQKSGRHCWDKSPKWSRRIKKDVDQQKYLLQLVTKNPYRLPTISTDGADEIADLVKLNMLDRVEYRWMGELMRTADCIAKGRFYSPLGTGKPNYKSDVGLSVESEEYNQMAKPSDKREEIFSRLKDDYQLQLLGTIDSKGTARTIICSQKVARSEESLDNYLKKYTETVPYFSSITSDQIIKFMYILEKEPNEELVTAISITLRSPVSIITGDAGTGKSVAIEIIYYICKIYHVGFRCCAFTGKAIANIMERLKLSSEDEIYFTTLHYLLYGLYKPYCNSEDNSENFMWQNDKEPFLLVLEEASMIPTWLISSLLNVVRKVDHKLQIVMVGDSNQLPPIGWGQFFNSVLRAGVFPISTLVKNYRTNSDFGRIIVHNAQTLKQVPLKKAIIWQDNIFDKKVYDLNYFLSLYKDTTNYNKVGIISPGNKRREEINSLAQQYLHNNNPNYIEYERFGKPVRWYINDKIIITKNNRQNRIYNGSDGIIVSINEQFSLDVKTAGQLIPGSYWIPNINDKYLTELRKSSDGKVYYRGRLYNEKEITIGAVSAQINNELHTFPIIYKQTEEDDDEEDEEDEIKDNKFMDISHLDLAYCITTHKAQGSERDTIIFDFPMKDAKYIPGGMANVYTAITRTRRNFYFRGYSNLFTDIHQYPNYVCHDRLPLLLQKNK